MSKVNKLWWVNCILFYCLPTAVAVAVGCFYRCDTFPSFLCFTYCIILVLILLRADLAVGYDLAPLASSAVGAFKSLAAALCAKLGL